MTNFTAKFLYYVQMCIHFQDKVNEEQPTDILPANWSQNEMYKLHYKRDKELFLLSGVKACDSFIFNFYVRTN